MILERLAAKIVDVDRLEREAEAPDTRHWTIRATVRGPEAVRELGVVYNSSYYSIGEHPGYRPEPGILDDLEDLDDEEEEEEEEDEEDDEEEEEEEDVGAVIRGLDSDSVQDSEEVKEKPLPPLPASASSSSAQPQPSSAAKAQ